MRMTKRAVLLCAVAGLVAVVGATGCAKQSYGLKTAVTGAPVEAADYSDKQWDPTGDCLECHVGFNHASEDDLGAQHVASVEEEVNCVDCHVDSPELKEVHENESAEGVECAVSEQACLECHDTKELATTTAQSTMIRDASGQAVNPHTVHKPEAGADVTCLSCHAGHDGKVAEETCLTCHHTQTIEGCASCHRSPEAYLDYLNEDMQAQIKAQMEAEAEQDDAAAAADGAAEGQPEGA